MKALNFPLDLTEVDITMPGEWPSTVKALCFVLVATTILALGYLVLIVDERVELVRAEHREDDLHREFAQSRATAAGLADLRARDAEASGGTGCDGRETSPRDRGSRASSRTLPARRSTNDLAIDRIDLADERQAGLLPRVAHWPSAWSGTTTTLGAFADDYRRPTPRLVTMHDFDLVPRSGPRNLSLTIEARTYRYAPETHEPSPSEGGVSESALPTLE